MARRHGNAAKISKWDKKQLIEDLVKRRLEGEAYTTLRKYLTETHGVSNRMIDYYMEDVVEKISKIYKENTDANKIANDLNETMARLDALYEAAQSPKDKLAILKEMSELRGLRKQKIDVTTGGNPIQITINRNSDKK